MRERENRGSKLLSLPFMNFLRSKLDRSGVKVAQREENYAWVPES